MLSAKYIGTRWTQPDFADELIDYWRSQSSEEHPLPIKVLRLPALAEDGITLDDTDPRNDPAFVAEHTEIKVGSRVRAIVQVFAEDPPVGTDVTVTAIKERLVLTNWPHPNDPTRGYWLTISDVAIEPSESEDA